MLGRSYPSCRLLVCRSGLTGGRRTAEQKRGGLEQLCLVRLPNERRFSVGILFPSRVPHQEAGLCILHV